MLSKLKKVIIFVGIGILLVVLFFTFMNSSDSAAPTLVSSNSTTTASTASGAARTTQSTSTAPQKEAQIAKDFLSLLLNVKNINLNDTIFSDVAFKSLKDSTILLIHDNSEGRVNPFAPIGSDPYATPQNSLPAATISAGTTQTSNLPGRAVSNSASNNNKSGSNSISEEDIFSGTDLPAPDFSFDGADGFAN